MHKNIKKIINDSKQLKKTEVHINNFIVKYPIYKGVLILGSGTVLAQLLNVLTMPIITRVYTPADFGLLAAYASILSVIVVAASFTYDIALVLPQDTDEAASIFWLCMLSLITTSIVFSIIFLFLKNSLIYYLHMDIIEKYIWLLVIGFFGSGLYNVLNYWTVRNRDYKRIASTKINQGISGAFFKIILGVFAYGPLGLIIGHIVSQVFGIGTFARKIWKNDWNELKKTKYGTIITVARKYYSFPLYNFPAMIINSLSFQLPVFMLLSIYGSQTVGLYSLAQSMLVLPGAFISGSIAQAFMGDASKLMREKAYELRPIYISTIRHMIFIAVPFIGSIALISPIIFPFVFGDVWSTAGYFCLPLALLVIPQFIFSPTSRLDIYGYNNWVFAWNIARTSTVFTGFYISHQLMLPVMTTLTIYGLIMLLMYLIDFWLNLKAISNVTIKRSQEEKMNEY